MKALPKSYLFAIALLGAIALFVALSYASIIESQNIFWVMQEFIAKWSIIIVFAILGGVFFGMLVTYRLFSVTQFTPFEKAMLEMRGEIRVIKESFDKYQKNEVISKISSMEKQMGNLVKALEDSGVNVKDQGKENDIGELPQLPQDPELGKSFSASTQEDSFEREEHD